MSKHNFTRSAARSHKTHNNTPFPLRDGEERKRAEQRSSEGIGGGKIQPQLETDNSRGFARKVRNMVQKGESVLSDCSHLWGENDVQESVWLSWREAGEV